MDRHGHRRSTLGAVGVAGRRQDVGDELGGGAAAGVDPIDHFDGNANFDAVVRPETMLAPG